MVTLCMSLISAMPLQSLNSYLTNLTFKTMYITGEIDLTDKTDRFVLAIVLFM